MDNQSSYVRVRERLEEISTQVKLKDTPLEKSLDLYEEALRLGGMCAEMIDRTDFTAEELAYLQGGPTGDAAAADADGAAADAGAAASGAAAEGGADVGAGADAAAVTPASDDAPTDTPGNDASNGEDDGDEPEHTDSH